MFSLNNWFCRPQVSQEAARPTTSTPRRTRLAVEPLEDRLAPAAIVLEAANGSWSDSLVGDYWYTIPGSTPPPIFHYIINDPLNDPPKISELPKSGGLGTSGSFGQPVISDGASPYDAYYSAYVNGAYGTTTDHTRGFLSGGANVFIRPDPTSTIYSQYVTLKAEFQATATFKVISTGEPDGTPIQVQVTGQGGHDIPDILYLLPGGMQFTNTIMSYTIGSETITTTTPSRDAIPRISTTRMISTTVGGGPITVAISGSTSLLAPYLYGLNDRTLTCGANISLSIPAAPPGIVDVTAKWDNATNGKMAFGTYLSGVKLDNPFTVQTSGSPATVRLRVPDMGLDKTSTVTQNTTQFNFDPGQLAGGSHSAIFTALDTSGAAIGKDYVGTIEVVDKLPFTLGVDIPGKGHVAASKLRLIAGVTTDAPQLEFTATATPPLPVYNDRLAVTYVERPAGTEGARQQQLISFQGGTATFSRAATNFGNFWASTGSNDYDYDIYLTPRAEYSYASDGPARLGQDASAHVFVIAVPDWLKGAEVKYSSDEAIAEALGQHTLGYSFRLQALPELKLSLPALTGLAAELFGSLTSSATAKLDFNLFARLTGSSSGDAKFGIGQLNLELTILGKTILPATNIKPDDFNLDVVGELQDARTLTGLGSVTVSTPSPINVLPLLGNNNKIELVFGNQSSSGTVKNKWTTDGSITLPVGGIVSASLSLGGAIYAELKELGIKGFLTFTPVRSKTGAVTGLDLLARDSWVQLNVKAASQLKVEGSIALGVDLLFWKPVNFLEAKLLALVDVLFAGQFRVSLAKPADLVVPDSYAGLKVSASFSYLVDLPDGKPSEYRPFTKEPLTFGPFQLRDDLKLPGDGDWPVLPLPTA